MLAGQALSGFSRMGNRAAALLHAWTLMAPSGCVFLFMDPQTQIGWESVEGLVRRCAGQIGGCKPFLGRYSRAPTTPSPWRQPRSGEWVRTRGEGGGKGAAPEEAVHKILGGPCS